MGKQKSGKERGRFSSKRKADAALRLLRGEALDELSRELGVTAATLSRWRDEFLAAGQAGLKSRERTAADDEVLRLKALVGDLTMRLELARERARALTGRLSRTLPTRCGAPMRPASRHSKKARSRSSRQWIIALQSAWVSMRPDEPRVSRHSSQFGKASVSGSAPTPRRSPEASSFAMTMEASTSATTSRMSCASSASPRALRSFALRKGTAALSDSSGL